MGREGCRGPAGWSGQLSQPPRQPLSQASKRARRAAARHPTMKHATMSTAQKVPSDSSSAASVVTAPDASGLSGALRRSIWRLVFGGWV
jgi:hypothetical protein